MLLERAIKYPGSFPGGLSRLILAQQLQDLGLIWSEPLHIVAYRTDTHDLGFMIQPAMRQRWELFHDERALKSVLTAAASLYTRYSETVGAIRSWNRMLQQGLEISKIDDNFLVIMDSMCNLDLLYYAAAHTGRSEFADAATRHATTLRKSNLRQEKPREGRRCYNGTMYSTIHVANFDPATGILKEQRTHQGYSDSSTWARGQAWAILGYAQTYLWTGDPIFLSTACGLAEFFIFRLETAPKAVDVPVTGEQRTRGRYVPMWDFDAVPDEDETGTGPLRDSSAAVIAANGMLVLAQALAGCGEAELSGRFHTLAVMIVEDTLDLCLAQEQAKLTVKGSTINVGDVEPGKTFESILKHATANYNPRALQRYWDHGLVYADYYLIEFGNRLLRMSLM